MILHCKRYRHNDSGEVFESASVPRRTELAMPELAKPRTGEET